MSNAFDYDLAVAKDLQRVRQTKSHIEPFDWFSRFWGIAVVAHLVGNPRSGQVFSDPTLLGWATLLTGLIAVTVVIDPSDRDRLRVMCAGVLVMVWFEAPVIGNHWLLAGFVSLAILVSLTTSNSWAWFSTTGRAVHLAFYSFAAFAKLNSAYFDPDVSCGAFYANESLASIGLPQMGSTLAWFVVVATALIEFSIPGLLVIRRTRNVGILLGLAFHILISFDLSQHFYDFTAVLGPLFLLWARPSLPVPLGRPLTPNLRAMLAALLTVLVLVSVLPLTRISQTILSDAVFIAWIPATLALIGFVVSRRGSPTSLALRPHDSIAWLLVGMVVLNGLTPYVELKTATSWNMYSNLSTAAESNHFLVRSTLPLSNGQADPVTVLDTNDEGLRRYVDSGYLLPERALRQYLYDHPTARADVIRNGEVQTVDREDGSNLNPFLEKFASYRAIDITEPARCQTQWLPAR